MVRYWKDFSIKPRQFGCILNLKVLSGQKAVLDARAICERTPIFFIGVTDRVTKFSSTFRPTEHDFEKRG